jgi:hypothetical protein
MNRSARRPLSRALVRTLLLGLCAALVSSCVWCPGYGYGGWHRYHCVPVHVCR